MKMLESKLIRLLMLTMVCRIAAPSASLSLQPQITAKYEIHDDRRVTFRIAAPRATEVTVGGDWIDWPQTVALTKDAEGIWSTTIGPLPADYYLYWFTIDSVPTPDPTNPTVKEGVYGVQNILFIKGPDIEFAGNAAVPHGEIRQVTYSGSVWKQPRRLHIYTPPDYEATTTRYPVLYLFHGGGDDDSSWSTIGRAGFILDNLFAANKAKPMIVVMPDLNKPRADGVRPTAPVEDVENFTDELLQDIVPLVEKRYRVAPGVANRAVAGVSAGGYETLYLLGTRTEQFDYFGIWSAPVDQRTVDQAEARYADLFSQPAARRKPKLVSLRVGEKDPGSPSVKALSDLFQKHEIAHDLSVSSGGHRWATWRRYLLEFAPLLFRLP